MHRNKVDAPSLLNTIQIRLNQAGGAWIMCADLLTRTLLNDIKAEPRETLNRLDVGMARTIWII